MKATLKTLAAVLLLCSAAAAESRYNNQLQPGLHTRAEVDRILGAPIRTLSANSYEYKPPAGAARLVVQYGTGAGIVERIEATFLKPYSRATMTQALNLPEQAQQSLVGKDGKLLEFFGEPAFLVFTYASGDTASGVSTLGYYTRDSFARTLAAAKPPAASPPPAKPAAAAGKAPAPSKAAPTSAAPQSPRSSAAALPGGAAPTPVTTPGPRGTLQDKPAAQGLQNPQAAAITTPGPRGALPKVSSANLPATTAAAAGTTYQGPSSGVLNWSGRVEKDQLVTIEGLPGIPVMIDLDAKEFSVVEPPSPSNRWQRLVVRSRNRKNASIAVRWTAIQ